MDEQRTKSLQERTEAKLRYARVHLDELRSMDSADGSDFDRAHQESFLFHLYGARDALLAELNHYYGTSLFSDDLSPGRLREALEKQGVKSPELRALRELEESEASWFRQMTDMSHHSNHIEGVPRAYFLGGENHRKVKLRNPRTGRLTERHFIEEFDDWLTQMTNFVRSLRASALVSSKARRP